ncbi:MAG: rhomboid family intramembrane serine protease [Candidatus Krumholzibacteria bacterium]|nr:rhomboid family intramembrane serine protease [Candidatus Krumholzibacteria bacterium]
MYFFYYVPVGINAELRRFPAMTAAYTLICVAVFVLVRYLPRLVDVDFDRLIYVPAEPELVTAVGAAFLHYGYLHLLGNVIYLVLFGRYVEDRMGPALFAVVFLSSAAIGNYLQGVFNIQILDDSTLGIIGASGAVSGLLGAFSVRFVRSKLRIAYWAFMPLQAYTRAGTAEVPAVLAIALWFVLQIVRGLVQTGGGEAQVAHVTHIGGFLWGFLLAIIFGQYGQGKIESLLRRGHRYLQKGEPYAAQGAFIRYLTYCPQDGRVYASLARAMVFSGNEQGAQKSYRKACEMLLDQQQRGECESLFQEALRGYSGFVLGSDHHLNLAFGLERNLKPELAVSAYENFEERYPLHAEAPFALLRAAGLYLHMFSNPVKAGHCYQRLIEKYPDDQWFDFAREQIRQLGLPPDTSSAHS